MIGIGGVFFRAKDPAGLRAWYERHLGIEDHEWGKIFEPTGQTVWSAFADDTEYFGPSGQALMLNYRVADLDAMLTQLRAGGVDVEEKVDAIEGIGRFGWATDPEGNRFELWEPAASEPGLNVG